MKKKSVAKAKIFFLLIYSAPFPCPRHPPLSFNSSLLQFKIHYYSNGFGGFASRWLQAPNKSMFGRKSWTQSSWGKKSIFPWKSHAVQLARVSPLLETPSLTSSHPSPGRRFQTKHYWIDLRIYGRVGRAQARPALPSSHPALFVSLECSRLLAPSRAATPLCPENGRYHSTSISY